MAQFLKSLIQIHKTMINMIETEQLIEMFRPDKVETVALNNLTLKLLPVPLFQLGKDSFAESNKKMYFNIGLTGN